MKQWYIDRYDTVFLTEPWQEVFLEIWIFARIDRGFGVAEIRDNRVELMCKKYKLDLLETLEILEQIERGSND